MILLRSVVRIFFSTIFYFSAGRKYIIPLFPSSIAVEHAHVIRLNFPAIPIFCMIRHSQGSFENRNRSLRSRWRPFDTIFAPLIEHRIFLVLRRRNMVEIIVEDLRFFKELRFFDLEFPKTKNSALSTIFGADERGTAHHLQPSILESENRITRYLRYSAQRSVRRSDRR